MEIVFIIVCLLLQWICLVIIGMLWQSRKVLKKIRIILDKKPETEENLKEATYLLELMDEIGLPWKFPKS